MEAVMPSVDLETQKIISTYQKIYNLIFRYGIFIILGIVSFGVVLSLHTRSFAPGKDLASFNGQFSKVPTMIHSGETHIAKGVIIKPELNTAPLSLDILQGFINISPEAQMGYGALAQHSGIILPISINLTVHDDNFTKEYFSSNTYEPESLDTFIKNTILTYPVKNIQNTLFAYKQKSLEENAIAANSLGLGIGIRAGTLPTDNSNVIPSDTSLRELFGLQCLGSFNLTDFFCYRNAAQFISRIPYLSFKNNLDELASLMADINNTPYAKPACDNLQFSFSKIAEADRVRETIFSLCGPDYVYAYHRIVDFATVNYELQGISNEKLYSDDDINIFKLLSLQQKIYQNTLQKNYDIGTIEVYLAFTQGLLTKRSNIEQLYKDMIYLYNNTYLQSALTQIAILNGNTKAMLRLTDVVKDINEGTIQLQRSILNPALLTYVSNSQASSTAQTNLVTFQDLFANKFTTFDNFIVTTQKVNNEDLSAQVEGYFTLDNDNKKVLFGGKYLFREDNFLLIDSTFPQNPELEVALNNLIAQDTIAIDIPFVYEFIKNNSNAGAKLSICELISARLSPKQCSSATALFDDGVTRILVKFDGYKIATITTNNEALTEKIQTSLQGVITTPSNIASTLVNIMKIVYPEKPKDDIGTGSTVDPNEFTIISKLREFFGVVPDKITLSNDKYITEFKLGEYKFIAAIDIANNYKMFPIAMKFTDKVVRINNLSLNLTNVSLTEINQFKSDPLGYIKKVDPETHAILQESIKK